MEALGVILGAVAIVVTVGIEWAKRPRLSIEAAEWKPDRPVVWTFAAVRVHNKPMSTILRWFLAREAAQACRATPDFYAWGADARLIPSVPGRERQPGAAAYDARSGNNTDSGRPRRVRPIAGLPREHDIRSSGATVRRSRWRYCGPGSSHRPRTRRTTHSCASNWVPKTCLPSRDRVWSFQ